MSIPFGNEPYALSNDGHPPSVVHLTGALRAAQAIGRGRRSLRGSAHGREAPDIRASSGFATTVSTSSAVDSLLQNDVRVDTVWAAVARLSLHGKPSRALQLSTFDVSTGVMDWGLQVEGKRPHDEETKG